MQRGRVRRTIELKAIIRFLPIVLTVSFDLSSKHKKLPLIFL